MGVAIKWYNFEHWLYTHKLRHLANLVYHMMQILFGCSIPPATVLEKGVKIAHFHGIVIHQDTVVEAGTIIYQNVTIGGGNSGWGAHIGKDVRIFAGACILGKVTIGDHAKIGANAVVLCDVPANCTAVGVPARIIQKQQETRKDKTCGGSSSRETEA